MTKTYVRPWRMRSVLAIIAAGFILSAMGCKTAKGPELAHPLYGAVIGENRLFTEPGDLVIQVRGEQTNVVQLVNPGTWVDDATWADIARWNAAGN